MTTFRGSLRAAVATAIAAADTIVVPDNIFLEYDWPTTPVSEPMLSVTARRWHYDDRTRGAGVPQFWSTARIGVEIRVAQTDQNGTGRALLVDQLDTLSDQVDAVMAGFIIGPPQMFRRIAQVDGEMTMSAEGAVHQGALDLGYAFEYSSDAVPQLTTLLEQVALFYIQKLRFGGRFGNRFKTVLGGFLTDIPQD